MVHKKDLGSPVFEVRVADFEEFTERNTIPATAPEKAPTGSPDFVDEVDELAEFSERASRCANDLGASAQKKGTKSPLLVEEVDDFEMFVERHPAPGVLSQSSGNPLPMQETPAARET